MAGTLQEQEGEHIRRYRRAGDVSIPVKTDAEVGGMGLQAGGHQGSPNAESAEDRTEAGMESLSEPLEGTNPMTPCSQTSGLWHGE